MGNGTRLDTAAETASQPGRGTLSMSIEHSTGNSQPATELGSADDEEVELLEWSPKTKSNQS